MGGLIVTADFIADHFAWLEELRRANYPLDRNQVPAHLTLFHALPPSLEEEAKRQLAVQARGTAPQAILASVMDLGGGVAFRVISDDLDHIRAGLADHFHGALISQDGPGWRPHVTIQNKVSNRQARELIARLEQSFRPRALGIAGLSLHRYLGGRWENIASYRFRGA